MSGIIKTYVAFDLETTGLRTREDEIIEIGAVKVVDGKVKDRFMEFVRPKHSISAMITSITGISNEMVRSSRPTKEVVEDFLRFCGDEILLGHNLMFDYKFMDRYAKTYGHSFQRKGIDTLNIARVVHKDLESKSLGSLCAHYEIENPAAHRAYHDALATAKLYQTMGHYFGARHPKLFEPTPLLYKEKKVEPATSKQKTFLKQLLDTYRLSLEEDVEGLTKSEASRQIDKIISEHGMLPKNRK